MNHEIDKSFQRVGDTDGSHIGDPGDLRWRNPPKDTEEDKLRKDHFVSEANQPIDTTGMVGAQMQSVGVQKQEEHDIGWAVRQMKFGKRVTRLGWNGKDMWVRMRQNYDRAYSDDGYYRVGFPEMKTVQGTLVPWLCSITDLVESDWVVVP